MMTANVAILLLSMLATGMLVFTALGRYVIDQKAQVLKTVAPQIVAMTIDMQIEHPSGINNRIYYNNIEVLAEITGSTVFITNAAGDIVAKTDTLQNVTKVPVPLLQKTLDGEISQFMGTLENTFADTVLTVGYPIEYNDEVVGAVFINAAMPDLDENRMLTNRVFFVVCAIVLMFAVIVLFFVSRRMTTPLKRMTQAARNIASGNFSSRVAVESNDEIGQLAATFNYMAVSLAQQDEAQSSFVANVSHELRTPMTTIRGFIENILSGTIPQERQGEYLQICLDETKRLSRLVSDMLDISKMTSGQFQLDMKSFDITELVRLTIIRFENAIEDKRLDLSVEFESEHMLVLADKDSISRVVTNLMDNAIKFSDPASHMSIRLFKKAGKAYVAIQNEGMGIDPEDIGFIWDRFYKTDRSRSEDKRGTGLGLYMVKNLLSAHGENIVVQSIDIPDNEYNGNPNHPARRTTFIFSLKTG